ncbi:hypothetical protein FIV41_15800 [Pseudomonas marginalis]|uniref:Uncharacterized protein n=1 Tax=Pseudomonas marginalis TaxID=298 RepID=A0A9X9BR15_PSEMA|nr:hypothetical protein [Pseudomonas marginalis]TWR59008.1 hypothetical protein FIV41_15800 [Pseudomonas marginalis]
MSSAEKDAARSTGISIAVVGIALGLAVAVYISPKNEYFLGNFTYLWLPQAAVLALALACKTSRESVGGIAIALALYLSVFAFWFSGRNADSMAWLGYFFSFHGALIGAGFAIVSEKPHHSRRKLQHHCDAATIFVSPLFELLRLLS